MSAGLGVMIQALGGNEETVNTVTNAIGKTIASVQVTEDRLEMRFEDGSGIYFSDEGQSCCEHRWMDCQDDLTSYAGEVFESAELKDGGCLTEGYGDKETQFLEIKTSKDTFSVSNYNEHNGYYGGFWIVSKELK